MIWPCFVFASLSYCFMDAFTEAGGINGLCVTVVMEVWVVGLGVVVVVVVVVVIGAVAALIVVLSASFSIPIKFGLLITNCTIGVAFCSSFDSESFVGRAVGVNKSMTTFDSFIVRYSWLWWYVEAFCSSSSFTAVWLRSFFIAAAFNLHIKLVMIHSDSQTRIMITGTFCSIAICLFTGATAAAVAAVF